VQLPDAQVSVALQVVPLLAVQVSVAPQYVMLVIGSMQLVPQRILPVLQLLAQTPLLQTDVVPAQTVPLLPPDLPQPAVAPQ